MLHLNLLPPEERTNLAYEFRGRAVLVIGGALAVACLLAIILFLPSVFLLVFQKSEVIRALELETAQQERLGLSKVRERVFAANRLAEVVLANSRRRDTPAEILLMVSQIVPSGVRLDRISYQAQGRQLELVGFAPDRARLLAFLRALEADTRFGEVSSPLANLIREVDIQFTITAKLK